MLSPFGDEEIDVQMDKGQERWLLYVTGRKIRAMSHEQFPNRSSKGPGIFTGKYISAWCKKIYLTTIYVYVYIHTYTCVYILVVDMQPPILVWILKDVYIETDRENENHEETKRQE